MGRRAIYHFPQTHLNLPSRWRFWFLCVSLPSLSSLRDLADRTAPQRTEYARLRYDLPLCSRNQTTHPRRIRLHLRHSDSYIRALPTHEDITLLVPERNLV